MSVELQEREASAPRDPRGSARHEARAVGRLATRTVRSSGWRSVLVALLIGASVAVATGVAIGARSAEPSPQERVTWQLGQADLSVSIGEPFGRLTFAELTTEQQDYLRATYGDVVVRNVVDLPPPDVRAAIDDLGIEGIEVAVVGMHRWHDPVHGEHLLYRTDLASPVLDGMYLVDGAVPGPGQAVVSKRWLERLGARVGDTVDLEGEPVEVVGTVRDPDRLTSAIAVVHAPADEASASSRTTYFVALPDGMDDDAVASEISDAIRQEERAGPEGIVRAVPLGVGVRSDTLEAYTPRSAGEAVVQAPSFIGTAVGAALLLQVAFVSAAAFATGTRRRLREYGLLGAIGASPRHVQSLVRREAMVVGGLGAVGGALVGAALAFAGRPLIELATSTLVPNVEVHPLDLAGPIALGTAAALVAAWVPARSAGRVPTTAALAGRMPLKRVPSWIAPASIAAAAIGYLVLAIQFAQPLRSTGDSVLIGLAVVLAIGGAAGLTVPALGVLGRVADRAPARLRLVLRDAARQRTRSAAASAALVVALLVPMLVAIGLATDAVTGARFYGNPELVAVGGPRLDGRYPVPLSDEQESAVREVVGDPVREAAVAPALFRQTPTERGASVIARAFEPAGPVVQSSAAFAEARNIYEVGVADAAALDLLGIADEDRAVLADGGALLIMPDDPYLEPRDDADDGLGAQRQLFLTDLGADGTTTEVPITATVADTDQNSHVVPGVLLAEERLDELGLERGPDRLLLDLGRPITLREASALYELDEGFRGVDIDVRPAGNDLDNLWKVVGLVGGGTALVALLILALTTALAATESDRDLELMTAIGARPRLRRSFHGLQAAMSGWLAGALALPTAVLIVLATWSQPWDPVVPWFWLVAIWLGVPALVGLVLALLMRSARVQPPRRIA